jgi:hypothetical protein
LLALKSILSTLILGLKVQNLGNLEFDQSRKRPFDVLKRPSIVSPTTETTRGKPLTSPLWFPLVFTRASSSSNYQRNLAFETISIDYMQATLNSYSINAGPETEEKAMNTLEKGRDTKRK